MYLLNQGHDMAISRIPRRVAPPRSMVLAHHLSGSKLRSIPLPSLLENVGNKYFFGE
jgi:hypothetical protein